MSNDDIGKKGSVPRVQAASAERELTETLKRRIKTYREGPDGQPVVTGELLHGDVILAVAARTEVTEAGKKPKARKCRDCKLFVVKKRAGIWPHRCRACKAEKSRERKRAYVAANAEKIREKNRLHHAANAEKIRERKRAYVAANAEKIRAYRAANAEKIRAHQRAYHAANAEKIRERRRAAYTARKISTENKKEG